MFLRSCKHLLAHRSRGSYEDCVLDAVVVLALINIMPSSEFHFLGAASAPSQLPFGFVWPVRADDHCFERCRFFVKVLPVQSSRGFPRSFERRNS